MPVSSARISTSSGRKYMTQLCKHWSHKLDVTFDENSGQIRFDNERSCRLNADDTGLELAVETTSEEALVRTQDTVVNHLKRFAFREDLGEIAWIKQP